MYLFLCFCLYVSKRDSWIVLSLSEGKSALATPRQMRFGALGGYSRGNRDVRLWAETRVECRESGREFEEGWVEEGLSKWPWSPTRVLSSRNKGHWSWDIDLFLRNTSTEMQRNSFVASCDFLWMFPGVYLKVTSIWERVWDCFVLSPFPHV